MGWNDEAIRERLQRVHQQWIDVVTPAFEPGLAELGCRPRALPDQRPSLRSS